MIFSQRNNAGIVMQLATAIALLLLLCWAAVPAHAGDVEYVGQLRTELVPNTEDTDPITFKPVQDVSRIKLATPLEPGMRITAGRLYHPQQDKSAILALYVESDTDEPMLFADINTDGVIADTERFKFAPSNDEAHTIVTVLNIPLQGSVFKTFPIMVQFMKNVRWTDVADNERLLFQSKAAFVMGMVDIRGRKIAVEYGYNAQTRKITPNNGWLGVDCDGDGVVDIDRASPEAADAQDEVVVFRVGEIYVSTKRIDLEKGQVVLREHPGTDYKRVELRIGNPFPDFTFTDFQGKKRRFSEFRGKYVLLDFWGLWCPACREELPYLKEAYSRYQARDFEILGMNTDEDPASITAWLKRNNLGWTQASKESIREVIVRVRVHLYPTTMLIDPEGKIISLNQSKKDQPSLRGRALLTSLDRILPP